MRSPTGEPRATPFGGVHSAILGLVVEVLLAVAYLAILGALTAVVVSL